MRFLKIGLYLQEKTMEKESKTKKEIKNDLETALDYLMRSVDDTSEMYSGYLIGLCQGIISNVIESILDEI